MIFLTVGTQFGFDRLVRTVDQWLAIRPQVQVFGQIGQARFQPRHFPSVPWLERGEFLQRLRSAEGVVSHAGIGTILQCLEEKKPLLVLPRRSALGECINDHQLITARQLDRQALVQVAYDERQLAEKLDVFHRDRPAPLAGVGSRDLIARIREYIASIERACQHSE
ncbi:MAG: hypothetical protein JSU86_00100 [Phycisphaerales bacterium]|nr:MAG: hypothetical protein JSU86_00100 [Phycisphaerales bacterium]